MNLDAEADALWARYCRATGHKGQFREVDQFGDNPVMADELLALVLAGIKQATCCLARDFDNRPLPAPGDHWIITDGQKRPRSIIKTTHVELMPICEVGAEFAELEGEGDKSLAYWKSAHDAYFLRQGEREGFVYSDEMIGVCESFQCVWPEPPHP